MHCTPVRHKNQVDLMVRELLSFTQLLGHSEVVFMSDNEPTMRQLLRMVVNARLSMGLATRSTTPQAYSHGNSLIENCIGRIRPLAGAFMHYIAQKIGIELSSSNALWSWAMRHACWVLNRYNTNQGMSSYELVTGKSYKGSTCVFGEPLFGYSKSNNKGSARWSRMLFVGKVDPQDSFILYNGSNLVLVKSVRRIQTDWRGHLRVVPTKGCRDAISASFKQPQGSIEPSAFYDADGAAVIEKAREEKQEELENQQMSLFDRPGIAVEEELVQVSGERTFPNPTNIWGGVMMMMTARCNPVVQVVLILLFKMRCSWLRMGLVKKFPIQVCVWMHPQHLCIFWKLPLLRLHQGETEQSECMRMKLRRSNHRNAPK